MKTSILSVLAVFSLYFCFSMNAQAICWSPSQCAEDAIKTLRELGYDKVFKDEETSAKFCAKGNYRESGFTLRSYQGLICKKSKYWAAWAEFICPNIPNIAEEYKNSKCHEYAQEHFPGKTPTDLIDIIATLKP